MNLEREQIKQILKQTIITLCNSGVNFDTELSVEGLIGITVDKEEVFLININENVNKSKATHESSNRTLTSKSRDKHSNRVQGNHSSVPKQKSERIAHDTLQHTVTVEDGYDIVTIEDKTDFCKDVPVYVEETDGTRVDQDPVEPVRLSYSRRKRKSNTPQKQPADLTQPPNAKRNRENLALDSWDECHSDDNQPSPGYDLAKHTHDNQIGHTSEIVVTNIKEEPSELYEEDMSLEPGKSRYYSSEEERQMLSSYAGEVSGSYPTYEGEGLTSLGVALQEVQVITQNMAIQEVDVSNKHDSLKQVGYCKEEMLAVEEDVVNSFDTSDLYTIPETSASPLAVCPPPVDVPHASKRGPPPALTDDEETELARWCLAITSLGERPSKSELQQKVKCILDEQGRTSQFKDNLPSEKWFIKFRRRNPEVAIVKWRK